MPLATRRDIGQYLIGSMPGPSVPVELRSLAREFDLGGVILFSRNIEVPEQVVELSAESEALGRDLPAWVSVDQEGGRVARLKDPFTKWPPMATLGRAGKGSEALAERFAKALADEPAIPAPAGDSPRVVSRIPCTPKRCTSRPRRGSVSSSRS